MNLVVRFVYFLYFLKFLSMAASLKKNLAKRRASRTFFEKTFAKAKEIIKLDTVDEARLFSMKESLLSQIEKLEVLDDKIEGQLDESSVEKDMR